MGRGELLVFWSVIIVAVLAVFLLASETRAGISTVYGRYPGGEQGIARPLPVSPDMQYPGYADVIELYGTRFPAFLVLGGTHKGEISKCRADLIWKAHITKPNGRFTCYTAPIDLAFGEGIDPFTVNRPFGNLFCYARTTGSESQGIDSEKAVREKILEVLVGKPDTYPWGAVSVINANNEVQPTPVCGVSYMPY